jgi:hypothetical protein
MCEDVFGISPNSASVMIGGSIAKQPESYFQECGYFRKSIPRTGLNDDLDRADHAWFTACGMPPTLRPTASNR